MSVTLNEDPSPADETQRSHSKRGEEKWFESDPLPEKKKVEKRKKKPQTKKAARRSPVSAVRKRETEPRRHQSGTKGGGLDEGKNPSKRGPRQNSVSIVGKRNVPKEKKALPERKYPREKRPGRRKSHGDEFRELLNMEAGTSSSDSKGMGERKIQCGVAIVRRWIIVASQKRKRVKPLQTTGTRQKGT